MNSNGCSTLQFSIGCLTETHEGNWIQQDVKYLLKLTGPIRLRSNIHFSTIWIGCHCHQCVWQTMVDITYTHSILYQCGQSWKLMPRRGWVKFFPPSSYEITNDSWLFGNNYIIMGNIKQYCTITTLGSQGVTCDGCEQYQTKFTGKKFTWWDINKFIFYPKQASRPCKTPNLLYGCRKNQIFLISPDGSTLNLIMIFGIISFLIRGLSGRIRLWKWLIRFKVLPSGLIRKIWFFQQWCSQPVMTCYKMLWMFNSRSIMMHNWT